MEQEVVLDVKVKNQSLKQQLREAVQEAQALQERFGATSQEAITAAQKVANLKEEISDMNQVFKVFNPEEKFNAVIGVTQGIAGGFQAVTGAMALFGTQSESVEKALLKVQAATAFAEGLNSIRGLGDAFSNLKLIAVNSFNAIKGAIGGTGIGLLVVALGVAINEFIKWSNEISEVEKNQEKLNKKLQKQSELIEEINEKNKKRRDFEAEYLKAQGVSEDAITAKRINNLLEEQKENTKAYKAKEELFLKQRELTQYYFKQGDKDKQEESAKEEKRLQEELKKLIENKKNINNQIDLIDANYNTQQEAKEKQREVEAEKKRKERAEKEAKDLEEKKNKNAQWLEETRKINEDLQYQISQRGVISQEEREKDFAASIEAGKKQAENALAILQNEEEMAKMRIDLKQKERDAILQLSQETLNGLVSLAEIGIKNEKKLEKIKKTAALIQIGIDTARAISSAVAAAASTSITPIDLAIKIASSIGIVLANIAKAKQLLSASSGGGSTPSLSTAATTTTTTASTTAGGVTGMQAPQQVGQGIANANAINNALNNPNMIRAVVVETDITDSQRRVRGIEDRATFG